MTKLTTNRLTEIRPSFATRRVDVSDIVAIDDDVSDLCPGDVVVARIDEIGHHGAIELPSGRRAKLFPGVEVLLACGARYAPDQFEADSPTAAGPGHLAAAGGIAGIVRAAHARMKPPTAIRILGAALGTAGRRVTLMDHRLPMPLATQREVPVIVVCGTAMNSGKSTTLAAMAHGFAALGGRVAALKVTGTGAGGDLWHFTDAGAAIVLDFTDAGFGTTFRAAPDDLVSGFALLVAEASARGADVILVEIADGLHQAETAALLNSLALRARVSGVVFAASDAMGAEAGVRRLAGMGHTVMAVSGLLTASPLARREAEAATGLPVLTVAELQDPVICQRLANTVAAPLLAVA